jgi:hypothetical protein
MTQPNKFVPIIISSVIIIVVSLFPLLNLINLVCCAGVILGVIAGTAYYNNQLKRARMLLQYKDGVAIGILSGIISAIVVVAVTTLITMVFKENPIPELYKILDSQGISLPPSAEQMLQKISDEYSKFGFSITLTLLSLVLDIVIYPIFGAIGGLIAVSIFTRRRPVNPPY